MMECRLWRIVDICIFQIRHRAIWSIESVDSTVSSFERQKYRKPENPKIWKPRYSVLCVVRVQYLRTYLLTLCFWLGSILLASLSSSQLINNRLEVARFEILNNPTVSSHPMHEHLGAVKSWANLVAIWSSLHRSSYCMVCSQHMVSISGRMTSTTNCSSSSLCPSICPSFILNTLNHSTSLRKLFREIKYLK